MIYLDHAGTTPIDKDVLKEMMPYFSDIFGNTLSQHSAGRAAANAVITSRDTIADIVGCKSEEIYFTSSGSEANNWALKGFAYANKDRGRHIIISAIEHPSLIQAGKDLQKDGFEVTYLLPDNQGIVRSESVQNAIKDDTIAVAVMYANNETGVIQPVEEIGKICRDRSVFFLCDCVQTAGVLPFPTQYVDALSFSAHKFYGPKGIGCLYLKSGTRINRLISGGHQERSMRGGTTNTPAIVGMAKALSLMVQNMEKTNLYVSGLRDAFTEGVLKSIKDVRLNGSSHRLPSNANFSFGGCDGEKILFSMDMQGIALSTGSACSSGAVNPSHVLVAMGQTEKEARSAVRFSFGRDNTLQEVEEVVRKLSKTVEFIRSQSK